MGVVCMAEQAHPVCREMALKIIKPGMDSKQVIARFEAERQALAMMDHPHIARVFDAGTTERGRPYLVMELVKGVPITDYCDREQLSVAERLELFVLICRAVKHAHQKGIIHLDLKPSNNLVTVIDGEAVPKVIDFGIARPPAACLPIPAELRAAFADAGRRLPQLWERLPVEARKTLLRALVTGVNLNPDETGVVTIRIAWRGGLVSERLIGVAVSTIRGTEREREILARIRRGVDLGRDHATIAGDLNREGLPPCRGAPFTDDGVMKFRRRHQIPSGLERLRRGERPPGYTPREMAELIGIDPSWISRKIGRSQILLEKDACYGCHLFPKSRSAVEQMKRLASGNVRQVSFPNEQRDG
jgi:serine/threonine protein kinase